MQDYAIFMLTPIGHVSTWSVGAQRIKGYAAEEIIGQHFSCFCTEADIRARKPGQALRAAAREGCFVDASWRVRKDGTRFWADVVITALRDADGQLCGFANVTRHATERQIAETALRHSEERFRLLAEASMCLGQSLDYETTLRIICRLTVPPVADWCCVYVQETDQSVRNTVVVATNPRTEGYLRTFMQQFPEWAEADTGGVASSTLHTGQSHIRNDIQDAHWQRIARDGKDLQLLRAIGALSVMAVPLLARGQVIGVMIFGADGFGRRFSSEDIAWAEELSRRAAIAVDLSRLFAAEHRALAAARSVAAQREAVLNQIVDGVVICDVDGRIAYVNHAAQRLGIMADVGNLISDHLQVEHLRTSTGEPYQSQDLPLVRAGRGEVVVGEELILAHADGKEVVVHCSAAPVRTQDGSMLGAVLVLHDVTAWRDLGRYKDEFFVNVSHDLRTPLATIRAAIELVLANEPPGTPDLIHQLLVNIDSATNRMSRLVEDLLELTRLQAGRTQLHQDCCDVRVLLMNILRAIEPLTSAREQHLRSNLPSGALWITADAERLERAMFNLLDNARKYTPHGGHIALTVQLQSSAVLISVADDGPGIPADEQEHIFERYYRLERVRSNSGSGLGLPIARAVVELHGGRLWVESAPGAGSTFYVALPVAPPAVMTPQGQRP